MRRRSNNELFYSTLIFSHLYKASSAKWLNVHLRTKWFWVRVQLQSFFDWPIERRRRSIFNASGWSKFPYVTHFPTACIGANSPTVKLNNTSSLDFGLSLFRECQERIAQLQIILSFWSVLKLKSHSNHIIRKKAYLLFSKFKIGNWESKVNLRLHLLIQKLPLSNFEMKVKLPAWSAILLL